VKEVLYSCQVPIGKGFARTAEQQIAALNSADLLDRVYAEDSFWEPGTANLGPFKDSLFDGLVATHMRQTSDRDELDIIKKTEEGKITGIGELRVPHTHPMIPSELYKIFHGWANASLLSARTAHLAGAKTILERQSVHATLQKKLVGGMDDLAEKRMLDEYDEADIILVPSRLIEDSFKAEGLGRKTQRIPLGVDLDKFKQISQPKHSFRALFVASNFDRKGGVHLVKAWETARAISKNVRTGILWIVGDVPPGDLGKGISAVGNLAEQEYVQTLQQCDVLVLPSLEDGFGLVVLEAMAVGKPVIISENVGAKDVVGESRDGYIVPVGDANKLARAIVSLADLPERRIEMGQQAHRSASRMTWQKYKESYLELVRSLL